MRPGPCRLGPSALTSMSIGSDCRGPARASRAEQSCLTKAFVVSSQPLGSQPELRRAVRLVLQETQLAKFLFLKRVVNSCRKLARTQRLGAIPP